jgi:hypothetical protein
MDLLNRVGSKGLEKLKKLDDIPPSFEFPQQSIFSFLTRL